MSRRYSLQDEANLVAQLNHLLHALALPISLISPTDLTPRLLIAILESLLGARLPMPMPTTTRALSQNDSDARTARVQSMKIFLGVLETDILQRDAGLSDIDPRRLAAGEDAEVFYVAEVLCSIGSDRYRDAELARARSVPLPRTPSPSPPPSPSPSRVARARPTIATLSPESQLDLDAASLFQSGTTTTRQSHPSLFSPFLADHSSSTTTSLFSDRHEDEYGRASDDSSDTGVSDILGGLPPLPSTPPPYLHTSPHRHQNGADDDDSLLFPADNRPITREQAFSAYHHDDNDVPVRSAVRYDGYIAPVDEEQELASFELSRSTTLSLSTSRDGNVAVAPSRRPRGGSVKAQYTRTLELLTERARLLTQLADLRNTVDGHGRGNGHGYG